MLFFTDVNRRGSRNMENHDSTFTQAQWRVMECLWEEDALTGREATEILEKKMGWNRSTTLTLLRRMEKKGVIASNVRSGVKTFYPVLRREDAALQEAESLLSRVYNGSVSMMVSAMSRNKALSRSEIDALRALLDGLEGK